MNHIDELSDTDLVGMSNNPENQDVAVSAEAHSCDVSYEIYFPEEVDYLGIARRKLSPGAFEIFRDLLSRVE